MEIDMTREEAIKVAYGIPVTKAQHEALQFLIPELRESEDERIRKLLVWQVHRNIEDETNDLAQSVYDGIKGHDPDLEESIEDWKKCLAWLEKQKEQKTEEKQDYSGLTDLERAIHRGFLCAGVENVPVAIIKETAQECFAKMKPAEWSEEDESQLDDIEKAISNYFDLNHAPQYHYWLEQKLKSLRSQSKQEWNEEDEIKLKLCEDSFRVPQTRQHLIQQGLTSGDMVSWLKSLRQHPKAELTLLDENIIEAAVAFVEQNDHFNVWRGIDKHTVLKALRSLKPHWKPSDEQIDALERTIRLANFGLEEDRRKALSSLLKQLKKQM